MPFERKALRKMNKETEAIILGYIARGLSQKEACFLAGNISSTTWNRYKQSHKITPEFIDLVKSKPSMKAKMVVTQDIEEGNPASAKWWLEHKESQEFNTKVVQDVTVTPVISMEDKEKALQEYMQKFIDMEGVPDEQSGRPALTESGAGGSEKVDARPRSKALQKVYDSGS